MTKNSGSSVHSGRSVLQVSFAILLLAALCHSQSPSDWPQFHNTNMQRSNPSETVLGVNNVANLQLRWSHGAGGEAVTAPAVANGVVYVGTSYPCDCVDALDSSTGALLWTYHTGGVVYPSPAVANGVVYVGSWDNHVYALNASTGALLWSYPTYALDSSPAVMSGAVYIGDIALAASTGALLWNHDGYYVSSSPAVANGTVYFSSWDGNIYALAASTGETLWTYNTGPANQGDCSPAVADGVVYVGSVEGVVYALNAGTGAKLWSFATGGYISSSPAVANGVVYVSSENNNVYALNASTGAKVWSYATGNPIFSSPAVANGVLYVGSDDGHVYALNASTGAKLWSYATGKSIYSSPTVVNGIVYVGSNDGNVYAFGLPTTVLNLRVIPYPTPPVQGALLSYAFKIWNQSTVDAWHEVLTTQVPAGTTFSGITISGTAGVSSCTTPPVGGTGPVTCYEHSRMRPGSTWTIRMTLLVTAPRGTVITETAAASSDNLASTTVTVHNTVH